MSHPSPTHIYVAGFTDGVVKVGRTSNPRQRFVTLMAEARRRGAYLDRKIVKPHSNPRYAESLLRTAARCSFPKAWGDEYFRSEFDAFVSGLTARFAMWGSEVVDLTSDSEVAA